jgi:hypothetical protein
MKIVSYYLLYYKKLGVLQMKQSQLLFSNEVVLEDERVMKLDYSLTEKVSETDQDSPYYGVRITKCLDDVVESDEVTGISTSKDTMVSFIKTLFQFEVTPITMVEVLDDLITQEI